MSKEVGAGGKFDIFLDSASIIKIISFVHQRCKISFRLTFALPIKYLIFCSNFVL